MAIFPIPGVRISGVSACVPSRIYENINYDLIGKKDRYALIKTIGVESKRHVETGTTSSDLCYHAAERLLKDMGWNREKVDLLVFVSQTRDYLMPATACILQDRLGLSRNCLAFDLDLGCSGYVYGLSVIYSMLANAGLKKALLLTGEIPTPNINFKDKSTFPLFGDAGAATAIEYDGISEAWFNLQTDGSGHKAIHIPDGAMRNYPDPEKTFKEEKIAEGIVRNRAQIALDGMTVFNFTIKEVRPNVLALLEKADKLKEEIDYFVFHQANKLMNETIRKQLKIDSEKYPYSIDRFGNTSSVSIPLTLVTELRNELIAAKKRMLFSGLGVGLSWGSCLLETDRVVCPELIELE